MLMLGSRGGFSSTSSQRCSVCSNLNTHHCNEGVWVGVAGFGCDAQGMHILLAISSISYCLSYLYVILIVHHILYFLQKKFFFI